MTTRNLQITIFEAPSETEAGTGRRSPRRGGGGHDPGENYVKPPPDDPGENYVKPPPDDWDPGENYVKPPPDDPGENYVKPPPDDPWSPWPGSRGPHGSPGHGPHGAASPPWVTAHYLPPASPGHDGCGCGCCCDETSRTPERPCITPGDYSGFLIVRLAKGVGPLTAETLWQLADEGGHPGLRELLELPLEGEEIEPPEAAEPEDEPDEDRPAETRRGGHGPKHRRGRGVEKGEPRSEEAEPAGPAGDPPWPPEPKGVLAGRPLIQLPDRSRTAAVNALRALEDQAARTWLRPRHGLARYWRVDLRAFPDRVQELLDRFGELAEVDLAYRELRSIDTAASSAYVSASTLAGDQGYFDAAPVGIGARTPRDRIAAEADRPGLTVIDLEQGWVVRHRELRQCLGPAGATAKELEDDEYQARTGLLVHGENREDDETGAGDHGTAVLGQLAAAGVGDLAVEGSAARFGRFWLASHYRKKQKKASRDNPFPGTNGHVASAIVSCLLGPQGKGAVLGAGDVLLLEVQRGRLPTETDEADFDAIRLATALGVIVVEAAGNGNHDLDRCDDPQTGRTLRRGASGFADSGAILVGAAFSDLPHDRAPFSNYGSRVDCYGWGEGVTTCGYGDLHDGGGDPNRFYTNTFNGTSSAAPIIAGAAAILQCLHERRTGGRLLPLPMRSLLASRATGTPQGPNVGGHIGVMPDLEAIVCGVLQLVPDLYLRRDPCDDGSDRGPDDALGSSPDLVVLAPAGGSAPGPRLGQRSDSAHHPAPGETRVDGGRIFVRMRNRGLVGSKASARVYASPAATLVRPEGWISVGTAELDTVLVGDKLRVSKALEWKPDWSADAFPAPGTGWPADSVRACTFLALFERDGGEVSRALPPGGEWFDWRRYLGFLRGPGVAWRNIHPIAEGGGASLAFFLAGAPDRTREFSFEVIQRLPAGAEVKLHLPRALTALLLQRQPGLSADPDTLTLPRRRSTRFGRIRLPRDLRAPACFEIDTGSGSKGLEEGHSLALRQLWRGEEVGRITWYVTRGVP